MRSRSTTAILFSLLLLVGCSDNNSPGDVNTPGDPSNDTSQPGPGGNNEELPLPSDPGSDTSAIAGLWDAAFEVEGGLDQRYVLISSNGLYTVYDYRQDAAATDGNCFLADDPLTLTLEDAATNTYSLPDDRSFTAVAEARKLRIQFAGEEPEEWNRVTGTTVIDLVLCT